MEFTVSVISIAKTYMKNSSGEWKEIGQLFSLKNKWGITPHLFIYNELLRQYLKNVFIKIWLTKNKKYYII